MKMKVALILQLLLLLVNSSENEPEKFLTETQTIVSNSYASAALKHDGTVVTWGDERYGGNSDTVQHNLRDIKKIVCTQGAFAALKQMQNSEWGSVITWGNKGYGGDSTSVQGKLMNIVEIVASNKGFIATNKDGEFIQWP